VPIKEFECQACKHRFEDILGINDPVPTACPKCGGGPLKQLLGTFRIAGVKRKSASDSEFDEGGDAPEEFGDDGGFGADGDPGSDGGGLADEAPADAGDGMDAGTDAGAGDDIKDEEV
jgi:putative FmdB family regulatory protein